MKVRTLKRVSTIINGKRVTLNKGDEADITDDKLLNECKEKGLIEIVSFEDLKKSSDVDTNLNLNNDLEGKKISKDEEVEEYLGREDLEKMKKIELVEYGASIGINLDEDNLKDDLVNAIDDYINLTLEEEENENI